jgi:hypothetical protein
MGRVLLALVSTLFLVTQVMAGAWTSNNFLYKPATGARGDDEKVKFDSGLNRVDSRLANEKWLNDSQYGGDLGTAIAAIDNAKTVLSLPAGNWPIAANLTVPATLTLKFAHGAVLTIPTGKTLTINATLEAGRYQIFSCAGTGKVAFATGAVDKVYPEWFYSGSGSWHTAVQSAVDACPANGQLYFSPRTYSFDAGFVVAEGKNLTIAGVPYQSKLQMSAAFSSSNILIDCQGLPVSPRLNTLAAIQGLYIKGQDNATKDGIAIKIAYPCVTLVKDISVQGVRNCALYTTGPWDLKLENFHTFGCGWSDGAADNRPAVYIHSPVLDPPNGYQNFNGVQISDMHLEATPGTALEMNTGSSVSIVNSKFHGRVVGYSNLANVGPLIKITDGSTINISNSLISMLRKDFVANGVTPTTVIGAVHITGVSRVGLSNNAFNGIGDEHGAAYDTYAIYNDGASGSTLILTGNQFRENIGDPARTNTPYNYWGASLGINSVVMAGNKYAVPSKAYIPTTALAGECYTLPIIGSSTNWADSTTYLWGGGGPMTSTSATIRKVMVAQSGFVKFVVLNFEGTAGTAENVGLYLRKNDTTDYTIATDLQLDENQRSRKVLWPLDTATGLIPCYVDFVHYNNLDYLHIKTITPAWATNPTAVTCYGFVTIQIP